jgi:hypothetical protein
MLIVVGSYNAWCCAKFVLRLEVQFNWHNICRMRCCYYISVPSGESLLMFLFFFNYILCDKTLSFSYLTKYY